MRTQSIVVQESQARSLVDAYLTAERRIEGKERDTETLAELMRRLEPLAADLRAALLRLAATRVLLAAPFDVDPDDDGAQTHRATGASTL